MLSSQTFVMPKLGRYALCLDTCDMYIYLENGPTHLLLVSTQTTAILVHFPRRKAQHLQKKKSIQQIQILGALGSSISTNNPTLVPEVT